MKPDCRDCGAAHEEHKGILEVCPDQQDRIVFETHYRPLLDQITDAVLAHRPKPKSKGAKRRTRRAKKSAKDAENG